VNCVSDVSYAGTQRRLDLRRVVLQHGDTGHLNGKLKRDSEHDLAKVGSVSENLIRLRVKMRTGTESIVCLSDQRTCLQALSALASSLTLRRISLNSS
jgi:hypothetical protein